MKYRRLTSTGDYVIGGGFNAFYVNSPEAVAQAVLTRLRLWYGEWFLDTTDGTPWLTGVLDKYTSATRDLVVKGRILSTPGVNSILKYSSSFDGNTRSFVVTVDLDTIYGPVPIQTLLPTTTAQ